MIVSIGATHITYSYVNNNPIMYNDQMGHFLKEFGNWLKDTATSMADAGKRVVNALWEGIKDAGNKIKEEWNDFTEKREEVKNRREQNKDATSQEKNIKNKKSSSKSSGNRPKNPNVSSTRNYASSMSSKTYSYSKKGCEGYERVGADIDWGKMLVGGVMAVGGVMIAVAAAPIVLPAVGVGAVSIGVTAAGALSGYAALSPIKANASSVPNEGVSNPISIGATHITYNF